MTKPLRILYAAGPGDVVGTYRWWLQGKEDPSVPDITYSSQFLDACRSLGAAGWLVSSHPRGELVDDGTFRVENRPIWWDGQSGVRFHLGRLVRALDLLGSAIRFRANVLIAGHGVHWFSLLLFPLFGVRVIPTLHNALWLEMGGPARLEGVLIRMARPLFASRSLAILSHPGICERQVWELTRTRPRPVYRFIPVYRSDALGGLPERGEARPPFRVLFAGRIEPEKGVFDLLDVARQLAQEGRADIEFDLCGTGSALDGLRQAATDAGVTSRFRCHGRLVGEPFRSLLGRSHAVVVPTRISEGFNAVVAEAILAGRPVITSRLCPAVELVRDACAEVAPCEVGEYLEAIVRMAGDPEYYEARRRACARLRQQFLDVDRGWGAALVRLIRAET
jgi:glycogen synthase